MQIQYRKGEVWLCDYDHLEPLEILEITNGYVRHKYGWDTATAWHEMAKTKLGVRVRILGVPLWIRRD